VETAAGILILKEAGGKKSSKDETMSKKKFRLTLDFRLSLLTQN